MTARICPYCKARDGFEAALIPLPCDYPAIWRCVSCGEEFDKVPEPSLDEWAEMVGDAERSWDADSEVKARKHARIFDLHQYQDYSLEGDRDRERRRR